MLKWFNLGNVAVAGSGFQGRGWLHAQDSNDSTSQHSMLQLRLTLYPVQSTVKAKPYLHNARLLEKLCLQR